PLCTSVLSSPTLFRSQRSVGGDRGDRRGELTGVSFVACLAVPARVVCLDVRPPVSLAPVEGRVGMPEQAGPVVARRGKGGHAGRDRKSTRLNPSHQIT